MASPYWRTLICAVVGVTPFGATFEPSRALMKALLPALNSPTMTRRKSSSSCSMERSSAAWWSGAAANFASAVRQPGEDAALFLEQLVLVVGENLAQHSCERSSRKRAKASIGRRAGWLEGSFAVSNRRIPDR
jgi:hypothetical protein